MAVSPSPHTAFIGGTVAQLPLPAAPPAQPARAAPETGGADVRPGLAAVATAAAAAVLSGSQRPVRRPAAARRERAVALNAIGSVETSRFLGSWSDPTPSKGAILSHGELLVSKLAQETIQLRASIAPEALRFGEEYTRGRGTTLNSYVLMDPKGSGQACLVDLPDSSDSTLFFDKLGGLGGCGWVNMLMLTYFDEDRWNALERLATFPRLAPLEVYCGTYCALSIEKLVAERPDLKGLMNINRVIRSGSTLRLFGGSRVVHLILTATPKFPEAICIFDDHSAMMMTGKFFSAHRAVPDGDPRDTAQGGWEALEADWHHCFDAYFYSDRATRALRKLKGYMHPSCPTRAKMIAPLHGPVAELNAVKLSDEYDKWITEKLQALEGGEVAVLYGSAYGKTAAMGEAIAKGLRSSGMKANLVNVEFTSSGQLADLLSSVDGCALGSPTLGGQVPTPVKQALGVLLQQAQLGGGSRRGRTKAIPVGVFGSYGWSGEAVDELHYRVKDAGFEEAFEPIRVRMTPTAEDLARCEEAGVKLAQAISRQKLEEKRDKGKKDIRKGGSETMKAFGRIMNTSCVLSKTVRGQQKAVPVSWVSQASFIPPGVTIAVPKSAEDVLGLATRGPAADYTLDETPEADQFLLSILPDGTKEPAEEAKKFKEESADNGCPIPKKAIAHMECCVRSVMDCGDHSLLYASIGGGKLFDGDAKSSMMPAKRVLKSLVSKAVSSPSGAWRADQARGAFCGGAASAGVGGRAAAPARSQLRAVLSEERTWTGLTPGKEYRLQVQTEKAIAPDTTCFRSLDWERDRFDIEFALERGTTYNAFLVHGEGIDTCLIDTSHKKFGELFLPELQASCDLATLKYLVVSHTEPDHSGLIGDVLDLAAAAGNEDLVVLGSKVCLQFLQELFPKHEFKSRVVKNGETIDLGGGHELQFVAAPNLHWPDTMFTYDKMTKHLFSCDAFGMHYCEESLYDEEDSKVLLPHYHLYYECLMKPNAKSVTQAFKRIKDLEIDIVAPGHGPLLKQHKADFLEKYASWSLDAAKKSAPRVLVLWTASYGSSERLAQSYAHGVSVTGAGVEMMELRSADSATEIAEHVAEANAIVVMSTPSGSADKASQALSTVVASVKKGQTVVVGESYGGDDEPVDSIVDRFSKMGVEVLAPIRVKEEPDERTCQLFEETGTDMGQALMGSEKTKQVKKTNADLAKALGRISSGLYIVTARRGTALSAMVASWVSPASEDPPGLTVAVAYDRAIGSLLQVGDKMVLNILEQGSSLSVIKHFLKRFPPGADRFEGVKWFEAPGNKCPVLEECCAFLECEVVSRMDSGDHWVTYLKVTDGKVKDADAATAVHYRKLGTYY